MMRVIMCIVYDSDPDFFYEESKNTYGYSNNLLREDV